MVFLPCASIGGHAVGTPALALLQWDLLGAVLEGLSKTLAAGGALDRGLSEKGAPHWRLALTNELVLCEGEWACCLASVVDGLLAMSGEQGSAVMHMLC